VRRAFPVAVLLVAATLVLPPSAVAGTYDVVACAGAAGGAQNAFGAVADPGMAAYNVCPNAPSNPASGMVTRASATAGPGWVGYWAGAYQIFEAPPGASLVSVTLDLAAIRLASYWTTGILAYDGDFNAPVGPYGCYAGSTGCAIGTQSFFGPVTVGLGGHAKFRFETRCGNLGSCDISASGFQPGTRALFAAANVTVRVQDYTAPAIAPSGGSLWQDGWHRGAEQAWQTMSDNVGIMIQRLYVDGALADVQDFRDPGWPSHVRCDFTRRRPCNDITPGGLSLDTRTLADGQHLIRIEAIDAAGNAGAHERRIDVDNTPPAHVEAYVAGGDGWRRVNDFEVGWQARADSGAPVVRAHYVICSAQDPGRCEQGSSPVGAGTLTGLEVPAEGENLLSVWLEDAAGNANEADAGAPVPLRLDQTPPEAAFEPTDSADPRRVDVAVADRASGVQEGTIELRRSGSREWQELDTAIENGRLRGYVDDVGLAAGLYELRAIVRDRAGNERISGERVGGGKMELSLPLRASSRITLWASRRCRKRRAVRPRRCRRRAPVRALRGSGRVVRGKLETGAGEPLAAGSIEVLEQPRGNRSFRQVTTVPLDRDGRFSYRVGRGVSRILRFGWKGNSLTKPALAEIRVLVPARTSINRSRGFLRNGRSVVFSGTLARGPVPDGGKLIDLQAFYRGRWRTFATPRTSVAGRWRFRYRFEATRGLVRYRFRARIRREAAYPYELGYSRIVAVTVRGP
jgi:hypothetical protein